MATVPAANEPATSEGILIGDKVYSEVFLTIDNSLIPEESLSPTPSMQDGLDLSTETDLRILGCELIQSAGILLRLPQVINRSVKLTSLKLSNYGGFILTIVMKQFRFDITKQAPITQ